MRYADRIVFVVKGKSEYDPITHAYTNEPDVKETVCCNVNHLGAEKKVKVFGQIKEDVIIVRFHRPYTKAFDFAEYAESDISKRYVLSKDINLRYESAMYLIEDASR